MRLQSATLFPIAILVSLAALTFWLERTTQIEMAPSGSRRHDPDYIIENLTAKRFDAQGKLLETVRAEHMEHFPDDDSTIVVRPDMTYLSARPTRITAETADMDSGGKTVVFNTNVKVVQTGGKEPDTIITTSTLTMLTDEEIARTKAPVAITQGRSVIHGNGMESNNKTGQAVLGGRVRGTIENKEK